LRQLDEDLTLLTPIQKNTMSHQITINYPETFPDALQQTREQFEQEAKWAMAVKLFEMKRLSSGMAAALIGIDRRIIIRFKKCLKLRVNNPKST
jgi:predicted HTH domain antitoxin